MKIKLWWAAFKVRIALKFLRTLDDTEGVEISVAAWIFGEE